MVDNLKAISQSLDFSLSQSIITFSPMTYTQYQTYNLCLRSRYRINITQLALQLLPYVVVPKNSNNQLFLIINGSKDSRYHPHFTNRASMYYLYSINRNIDRYYSCSNIEKPYVKSQKISSLFLELVDVFFTLSVKVLKDFIFIQLLKATCKAKRQ